MPSVRSYKGLGGGRRPSSFFVPRRLSTHIGRRGSFFSDRRHSLLGRRQSSRLSFLKRPRAATSYDDVVVEEVPDEVDMYDDALRTAHTDAVFFSTLCNVDPSDPLAVASVIRPLHPDEAAELCNRKIRSKKRKADAEKVGRPPNSWICYRGDLLRRLKGEKRGDILQRKQADLNKDIGVLWRLESKEVKGYYMKKARLLAEDHQQKYPNYQYRPNKPDGTPWTPPKQTSKRRRKPNSGRRPHRIATSGRNGFTSPAQASATIPAIASSSRREIRTPFSGYEGSPSSTRVHWTPDSDCVDPRALQALERWDSRSAMAIDEEGSFDGDDEEEGHENAMGGPSFAGLDNYVFPPRDAAGTPATTGLGLDPGPMPALPLSGGYALSPNPSQDSMLVDIDPLAPSPFLSADPNDLHLHNLPGLAFDGTPTSSGPPSVFNRTPPAPVTWPGDVSFFSSARDHLALPRPLPLPAPSLTNATLPFSNYELGSSHPAGPFDPFDFAWHDTLDLGLDAKDGTAAASSSKLQVPTPVRPFGSMATVLLNRSRSPSAEPFDPQLRV